MGAKKKPRKPRISSSPEKQVRIRQRFLGQLAKGRPPAVAARIARVARSTVFAWKAADPEFAALWFEAQDSGVDLVEDAFIRRAIKYSDSNAQFYLKAHRPETYGRRETVTTKTLTVTMTLEESRERLRELNIVSLIEGDREEDHLVIDHEG